MRSPYTGKEMRKLIEDRSVVYRGNEYHYRHTCYICEDTKECFTTTALDEANISQVYNQYRIEYGIPFPDEIKALREKYGVSAIMMSRILGFGDNQYRLYENGDMPSVSNGRLIMSIIDVPQTFVSYIESSKQAIGEKEYNRLLLIVENTPIGDKTKCEWVFGVTKRNIYSGYAKQSLSTLMNCILYFIQQNKQVFKTKMNKLLFYADFLSYKKYGIGITGLSYRAIQFGPVPNRWDRVYSAFDEITSIPIIVKDDIEGEVLTSDIDCDMNALTKEQLEILSCVQHNFRGLSSHDLSVLSHNEDAWKCNLGTNNPIDYSYAFNLVGIAE